MAPPPIQPINKPINFADGESPPRPPHSSGRKGAASELLQEKFKVRVRDAQTWGDSQLHAAPGVCVQLAWLA